MSEDVAEFTAQRGAPPPERLWLVFMGCGETSWCDTPDPNGDGEPSVGYVLAARADRAEAALRDIATEAERENGGWVHLKRSIAINARAALEPKP